jgi:hydroxypyruvate reductase
MGKAAVPMAEGVTSVLRDSLSTSQVLDGIVVGTTLPDRQHERLRYFLGGHPVPDKNSVIAANAILELLSTCDEECLVLLLLRIW